MPKKMVTGAAGILLFCFLVHADSLTVSFTSKQFTGQYSPLRDVAVWVEDDAGNFVKTLSEWGGDRRDLGIWSAVSDRSLVDATTGATVLGSSSNLSAKWNMTDLSQQPVANGTYWLSIEATSDDNNMTGPRVKVKIVLDGISKTLTAVDTSLNSGSTYITNVNVMIAATNSGIASESHSVSGTRQFEVVIGKTPVAVLLRANESIVISLYSSDGARVATRTLKPGAQISRATLAFDELSTGKYLCKVKTSTRSFAKAVNIVR
jgi:hypothetical protein